MKWILAIVLVGVAWTAYGQVSTDEAQRRLEQKQQAREKLVTIKQGELDDMRAELAALKSQVASLRAKIANATTADLQAKEKQARENDKSKKNAQEEENKDPVLTALKNGRLAVGMTKDQVLKVFAMNQRNYGGGGPITYTVRTREITTSKGPVSIEHWESNWYYPGLFSSLEFRNGIVDSFEMD